MDPITIGAGAYAIGTALYNVYQAHKTREREDNAVQRRVADLQRAGLSPTLAAGSAAASTATPSISTDSNPFMEYLSAKQGKANIAQTNAGTELAKMQAGTEEYKQEQISALTQESIQHALNMQSEKDGLDLRNSWINRDLASKLRLADAEFNHTNALTLKIGQESELLKAQTTYEQNKLDLLLTQLDNEKILRDMNNVDLSWRNAINRGTLFNSYTSGSLFKTLLGTLPAATEMLGHDFAHENDFDKSWYWENRK